MINNGKLPFSLCLFRGCLGNDKIIDLLIRSGVNVDLPDNNQRTALHYAAYLGI